MTSTNMVQTSVLTGIVSNKNDKYIASYDWKLTIRINGRYLVLQKMAIAQVFEIENGKKYFDEEQSHQLIKAIN